MTKKAKDSFRSIKTAKAAKSTKNSNVKETRPPSRKQTAVLAKAHRRIGKNQNGIPKKSSSRKSTTKKTIASKSEKQKKALLATKYELRSKKSRPVGRVQVSNREKTKAEQKNRKISKKPKNKSSPQNPLLKKAKLSLSRTNKKTSVRKDKSRELARPKKEKTIEAKTLVCKSAQEHKLTKETWIDDSGEAPFPRKAVNIPASFIANTGAEDFTHLTPIGSATSLLPSMKDICGQETGKPKQSITSMLMNKTNSMDDLPEAQDLMDFTHTDPHKLFKISYSDRPNLGIREFNEVNINDQIQESVKRVPSVKDLVAEKPNDENIKPRQQDCSEKPKPVNKPTPSGQRPRESKAMQIFYEHICDKDLLKKIKTDSELLDKVKSVCPRKYYRILSVFNRLESIFVQITQKSHFLSSINTKFPDKQITIDDIVAIMYIEKNYYVIDWHFNTHLNDYDLFIKADIFELKNSRMGMKIQDIQRSRALRIGTKLLEFVIKAFDDFVAAMPEGTVKSLEIFEQFLDSPASEVPRPKFKPKPESHYVS